MKRRLIIFVFALVCYFAFPLPVKAQCSICARTASQLGERPARGLNGGIIYLAFTPLMVAGFIGYRWWRSNRDE